VRPEPVANATIQTNALKVAAHQLQPAVRS
jgi:hypothetical protein